MSDVFGPDVSAWDAHFPAGPWQIGIVRQSIGLGTDSLAAQHVAAARAIPSMRFVGVYHFVEHGIDPRAQADVFLRHAALNRADFIVGDVEGRTTAAEGAAFFARIREVGDLALRYVQASRRGEQMGSVQDWIAAWGLPRLAAGGLIWQAWSSDDTAVPRPAWALGHGDWNEVLDVAGLEAHIAARRAALGQGPATPPAAGGDVAKYISASGYDAASLPRIDLPPKTTIRELDGTAVNQVGPTTVPTSGLVDGHSGQRLVLVKSRRYVGDGIYRPVWLAADVDPKTPLEQPVAIAAKAAIGDVEPFDALLAVD